ncbi:hypothetical protein GALMADRAFT_1193634 [Galerina marginata CBS 339.88]|uniref:Uncharacterized protein n=1 Tax=Galerina marginata (strain CBS 339.88) TaxID=685588 RepID=A0A067TKC6_GALM3|nr:hypothetical protein GALMADRAFT_1193634 [Galerina marginata CBS 339.88]
MGFLKSIARAILQCLWPDDSPDEQYEKAEAAYQEYLSTKNRKYLNTALQDYKSAHSARIKDEHSELANTEVNYAAALWAEYELDGQPPEKLTRIIELDEHALGLWKAASPKPVGYPVLLLNLFTAYFHSYLAAAHNQGPKVSLNLELYDELKQYSQQLDVSSDTRRKMLMMLGTALSTRCDLDNTSDKLDEAINHLEQALKLSETHVVTEGEDGERGTELAAFHTGCLLKLATAYFVRYNLSNGSQDLDDAIRCNDSARQALPNDDPERSLCLYNLAHQLFKRYEQAREQIASPVLLDTRLTANRGMEDLKEAERTAGEAQRLLETAPPESELKQLVNELLDVLKVHSAASSRVPSRAPTPTPSPHPSDVRGS